MSRPNLRLDCVWRSVEALVVCQCAELTKRLADHYENSARPKFDSAGAHVEGGVTARYIRKLKEGKASPTLAVVVKLAKALAVEAHELVEQAVACAA